MHRLETRIRSINPAAPLYRTVKAQIDMMRVIGINAYSAKPSTLPLDMGDTCAHGESCRIDHHHSKNHHEGVTSMQVRCPRLSSSQIEKLDEWIRSVLWEGKIPSGPDAGNEKCEVEVLRCKGAFSTESGEMYVLQGVRSMYELNRVDGERDMGVPDEGKLVFIGKGLDEVARNSLLNAIR